jgi:transposase
MFTSVLAPAAAVIAVDVGKTTAAVLVTDAARRRLLGPVEFVMTGSGVGQVIGSARAVLPDGVVRVGVEAAGHYHRPLLSGSVWPGWEVVELNPAHVAEQRRVMGRRRVKTDAIDLDAWPSPRTVEASTIRRVMPEQRRKFDAEFREGAVRLVRETGKPIAQIARDLGVNEGTLGNWVVKDRASREGVEGLSRDDAAELKRLRAEVAELRMERDVLKRSVVLWVKEATK